MHGVLLRESTECSQLNRQFLLVQLQHSNFNDILGTHPKGRYSAIVLNDLHIGATVRLISSAVNQVQSVFLFVCLSVCVCVSRLSVFPQLSVSAIYLPIYVPNTLGHRRCFPTKKQNTVIKRCCDVSADPEPSYRVYQCQTITIT